MPAPTAAAEPLDEPPGVRAAPYGILVNKEGHRFADEAPGTVDAHYERVTRRIYEQTDGLERVAFDVIQDSLCGSWMIHCGSKENRDGQTVTDGVA
jgi:hypothetical protein